MSWHGVWCIPVIKLDLYISLCPPQAADSDGNFDGKLNFEEFCTLFKELASRPELKRLFSLYSSKMEWLTVKDLQKFLQVEQGADNPSIEFCTQLIQKYEPTDEGKEQVKLMTLYHTLPRFSHMKWTIFT